MAYNYFGREVEQDPELGMVEGKHLPETDREKSDDWWYMGHPCDAYLENRDHNGRLCSGLESHTGFCAPCTIKLREWIKTECPTFAEAIHEWVVDGRLW